MITAQDRQILRDLAKRMAEIAMLPEMAERRALWGKHNDLERVRPLILVFPECGWEELLTPADLQCEDPHTRGMEYGLRQQIYTFEHFQSDNVIEREWNVGKVIHSTGWGLQPRHHASTQARGSWSFDPVIQGPEDLRKLRFPEISYDEPATMRNYSEAQELFGDILDVKLRGVGHISFHLMQQYSDLRGLEQTMLDMYEQPEMLHDAMAFLEEGHRRILRQYQEQNLLSLNNDNTYHSTGGNGFTTQLPKPGCNPEKPRLCDLWASSESQELAQVSPAMHAEFALAYEKRLLEPFGLIGYGCCEDLTRKLDDVLAIPNIRRVSISPWADVDQCAEKLQNKAIFSWKPNPAYLVGDFNADKLRPYIEHTLQVTKNCVLEIILKDTHTCEHHPERFDQWSQITRELVNTCAG